MDRRIVRDLSSHSRILSPTTNGPTDSSGGGVDPRISQRDNARIASRRC